MLRKKRQIPLVLNYLQSLNCVRFLKKVISLVKQKIEVYPDRKRWRCEIGGKDGCRILFFFLKMQDAGRRIQGGRYYEGI